MSLSTKILFADDQIDQAMFVYLFIFKKVLV